MNWVGLVTSCMCYTLDPVQKMPKLKLTNLGKFYIFKQTFTITANRQLHVFLEGVFP